MGFILIDFKKRDERKRLHRLTPDLLKKMDRWISSCTDSTPSEEECKALEEAQIAKLTEEFDKEAARLKRVKDEVPKEREEFVQFLGWKRGKLYLKFSDAIGALKQQAQDTLKQCADSFSKFEKEQKESFPVGEDELTTELAEFLADTNKFVEDTYPEGVKGLDGYDDELPAGVQSYAEFLAMVAAKESELKEANKKAIPAAVDQLKSGSKARFQNIINEAVMKATDEIVKDLSDDVLPYLEEGEMAALRQELIESAKAYGKTRLE